MGKKVRHDDLHRYPPIVFCFLLLVIHFCPIFQVSGAKCARTPRRRRVSSFSIPKKVSSMCHGLHDIGIFLFSPLWAPSVSSLFLQQLASEGVCWPSSGQLCFSFPKKKRVGEEENADDTTLP